MLQIVSGNMADVKIANLAAEQIINHSTHVNKENGLRKFSFGLTKCIG